MLHLHHLQNSRSFRIVWLLEELGLDYQLTSYERTQAYLAPEQLEDIHPMGKAPILQISNDGGNGNGNDDDDGKGNAAEDGKQALAESGFIIEYLLKHHDAQHRLKPAESDEAAWQDYTFWLHFAEASAMPPLLMRLVFSKVVENSPALIRPISKKIQQQVEAGMINKNIDKVFALIEAQLSQHQWFAGDSFSAADIQMHFVIAAANSRSRLDRHRYANTLNWLKRCESRPAFIQAVEKGGRLDF